MSIAFLVYDPEKKRRKNNSFDGNDNIGALVVKDILEKAGHKISFCASGTAHKHDIVLVSFTSTYDIFAFYKSVALRADWQRGKRAFKVVGGGFGMQNPTTIRNYVDYAVFGRAENIISDLINCVLGGNIFEHDSVMKLPDIYSVKIAQAKNVINVKYNNWSESQIGCPNKCKFCHYTWAREYINIKNNYELSGLYGTKTKEILFKDVFGIKEKPAMFKSAFDGFSEKIRFLYGKKITNSEIVDGLNYLGSFDGTTRAKLYNISNFPNETDFDFEEFVDIIKKVNPKNRLHLKLHTTPLVPSLLTPLQFCSVNIKKDWNKEGYKKRYLIKKDNFICYHSAMNTGSFTHLQEVIALRATHETDNLFHTMCFSKKLRSKNSLQKIKMIENAFDIEQYLRRYDPDEPKHPGWFLNSYMPKKTLKKAFLWAERQFK